MAVRGALGETRPTTACRALGQTPLLSVLMLSGRSQTLILQQQIAFVGYNFVAGFAVAEFRVEADG